MPAFARVCVCFDYPSTWEAEEPASVSVKSNRYRSDEPWVAVRPGRFLSQNSSLWCRLWCWLWPPFAPNDNFSVSTLVRSFSSFRRVSGMRCDFQVVVGFEVTVCAVWSVVIVVIYAPTYISCNSISSITSLSIMVQHEQSVLPVLTLHLHRYCCSSVCSNRCLDSSVANMAVASVAEVCSGDEFACEPDTTTQALRALFQMMWYILFILLFSLVCLNG